ncbi:MAG: hypothetical protein CVV27_09650 [Candidatus Melainabacteria bacterium HGW-Melainabacteria-1]|nr:MAG: hypothetical protein CVV27_09650 [Candidatus Melainabacteria bacterium HGW-Melainabacteria-1]
MEAVQGPQNVVEDFLLDFSKKCVEFGYYCDQYMREEINLGEITRRMSEATAEGESFFMTHHAMMTPEQVYRYQIMQRTLDEMTTNLIETEIKRNKLVIREALSKGEYFIVNITYNSIHSSIYMAYTGDSMRADRDNKLAELQKEQELTQALMKVLKVIEQKLKPETFDEFEFRKLHKAFQIYVEYFKRVERTPIKIACDDRVLNLYRELAKYLEDGRWFGDRHECFKQMHLFAECLRECLSLAQLEEIEALVELIRPPDPNEVLERLYHEAMHAEGEANVYSAVVAFNNFIQEFPHEPKVGEYKRKLRQYLSQKGMT